MSDPQGHLPPPPKGPGGAPKFQHVVGIIHTNYLAYSLKEPAGTLKTPAGVPGPAAPLGLDAMCCVLYCKVQSVAAEQQGNVLWGKTTAGRK